MSEEILEGYVVDIACLRKYPRAELAARARGHSRECGMMGHCIESGFALVDEAGGVALLDPAATPKVVSALEATDREKGIRMRATRRPDQDGHMETDRLDLLD